ncbi:hypothetical protein BKA70DRAFT_1433758 [Coprinopsis sp. MPI-PUGE-AT-0042]|nr:hypothetical protein BKA70DRAFT_1433758 [Coprinopsis sp. MPI-PUGE-AT-0042]
MPEWREMYAHWQTCRYFLFIVWAASSKTLLRLWADASNAERAYGTDGNVFPLDSLCRIKRGANKAQTFLAPEATLQSTANPNPPSIRSLSWILRDVHRNGRALFFDFGSIYLKMAFLTHMSVQFYSKKMWEKSVRVVPRQTRGFKVGLALEFEDFVLAFNTIDLVFQPQWIPIPPTSRQLDPVLRFDLGNDVLRDYRGFVAGVSEWIKSRRNGRGARNGLACEVMRNASLVWVGVGVYSVCEVFFLAGLSPFLLEWEVFDFPSRTARLCEAFWQFAYDARSIFSDVIKRTLVENVIAPTDSHRMRYTAYLAVYAKSQVRVTPRHAKFIRVYTARLRQLNESGNYCYRDVMHPPVYDAFEPTYIKDALFPSNTEDIRNAIQEKPFDLQHLIFGIDANAVAIDPLTEMFKESGLLGYETFLKRSRYDVYDPLDVTPLKQYVQVDTRLYQASKHIWSAVPSFPARVLAMKLRTFPKRLKVIKPILGEEKAQKLFNHIIRFTKSVAIGPLEYCGHACPIQGPRNTVRTKSVEDEKASQGHAFEDDDVLPLPVPTAGPSQLRKSVDRYLADTGRQLLEEEGAGSQVIGMKRRRSQRNR